MRVLLHACCGPCLYVPLRALRDEGYEVTVFWYNPNIQPFREYARRVDALKKIAGLLGVEVVWDMEYSPEDWLSAALRASDPGERCRLCYIMRLRRTAEMAAEKNCDLFTTTLLYSPHQKHDLVREIGVEVGDEKGVEFLYRDWRPASPQGERYARSEGAYVQGYCGCIFSERDRYWKPLI